MASGEHLRDVTTNQRTLIIFFSRRTGVTLRQLCLERNTAGALCFSCLEAMCFSCGGETPIRGRRVLNGDSVCQPHQWKCSLQPRGGKFNTKFKSVLVFWTTFQLENNTNNNVSFNLTSGFVYVTFLSENVKICCVSSVRVHGNDSQNHWITQLLTTAPILELFSPVTNRC